MGTQGRKNMFGSVVKVAEMQSEGAAGASTEHYKGALATTFGFARLVIDDSKYV